MARKKSKKATSTQVEKSTALDSLPEAAAVFPFPIVGIGASAGGLEALTTLLQSLPPDTGMAFVIIQHLDPRHASALTEILAKSTRMSVSEVRDGVEVKPNLIYVIAPANDLVISEGRLKLTRREPSRLPQRPIDTFLRSLAEEVKARAVGVILSGTGTDGTLGLKAIKEEGGITFAQDVTAAHHGMPDSAIAGDCVDFVLSPDKIAAELARIAHHPSVASVPETVPPAPTPPGREDAFGAILRMLTEASGIDFTQYKQPTLKRRIDRRMVLRRLESLQNYLDCLRSEPGELEALYHEMLIQVTSFFRDPEVFEALQSSVFPELIKERGPEAPLRIWVPGCSTGEEVYSIAICLLEYLHRKSLSPPVKIFATDVSDPAIHKARAGIYKESILAEVSTERLRQFFVKIDGGYQIVKAVRDLCIFARQNVTRDPPFSQLDLISCRNVLIYLGPVLQNRVIPVFHYALRPDGFLVLGTAESVGAFGDLFQPFDKKHRFYRRTSATSRLTFEYTPSAHAGAGHTMPEIRGDALLRPHDLQREADRVVLSKYAPAGVVIDDALEVLQFRGHTGACLEPAPGAPSHNLLQMCREGLLPDLQAAIEAAKTTGVPERREAVRVKTNSHYSHFNVEVIPITLPGTPNRCFVVLFEELGPATHTDEGDGKVHGRQKRTKGEIPKIQSEQVREIERLSQELAATKAYLQSVIEAKEAGNEELKAANEEIISSNEELQSTNEELETAKEELQATNEELATVNDELHDRIRVATQMNDDLSNLIDSVNIPIVMLGQDLRVRRFSPSAQKMLNLRIGDIGRHISDFKPKINVPDLVPYIHEVLDRLTIAEREVVDEEGRWYTLLIRPYRTADNKIEGATLSLIDIDALKRRERESTAALNFARTIIEALPGAILVLDGKLRVRFANRAFYELFQVSAEETEKQLIYSVGAGQWNIPPLRLILDEVIPSRESLRDYRVETDFPKIGHRVMLLNAERIQEALPDSQPPLVLLSIEDITDRDGAAPPAKEQ